MLITSTAVLAVPSSPLTDAALAIVSVSEPPALRNHSIRAFLFARIVAGDTGLVSHPDYDEELLFCATLMHDLGLGSRATGTARFEVEGADLAAGVLRAQGVAEDSLDTVWEAIALHTSGGIAERRGVIASLTRAGVAADLGRVPAVGAYEAEIHAAHPRLDAVRTLVDAVVAHADRSDAAAAPYTFPGELARERHTHGVTRLERSAATAPWAQ